MMKVTVSPPLQGLWVFAPSTPGRWPIGVNLMETALSEATAVATSCSPRRASRGMPTPESLVSPVGAAFGVSSGKSHLPIILESPPVGPDTAPSGGLSVLLIAFCSTAGSPWAK